MDTITDRSTLEGKLLPELQQIAQTLGIEGGARLRKAGLIDAIVDRSSGDGTSNGGPDASPSTGSPAAATITRADEEASAEMVEEGSPVVPTAEQDGEMVTEGSRVAAEPGNGRDTREGRDRNQREDRPDRDRNDRSRGDRGRGDAGRSDGARSDGARSDAGRSREREQATSSQPPQGDQSQGGQSRDQGGDADARSRRQRPSREDRRRAREERRVREEQERAEEMLNAPTATGLLDILPEGYGFLRTSGYLPGPEDIYVSLSQVRKYSLRKGDVVVGKVRRPRDNEKYWALLEVDTVSDLDPEAAKGRPNFDKLTPLFPEQRFRLEHEGSAITERIVDMVAPIGKGQRGMVVSPPKAGKTTVLKQIANGILNSSPDTHVMVLLVDERPEEVTDWQRTVGAAEVVYSTFDKPADQHIQVTELVLERARRLAETGRDVAILLDSITRLARAYNLAAPASGKILSGGVDSTALYPPKRFFGAARNIEEGGSLTIIASALVETGSRMDEVIFEEFKGTGNMELRLDRSLAEKRLFPAINVDASGTRKEELLLPPEELVLVIKLRRVLHALEPGAALELLTDKIRATKSNEQFLKEISKAPSGS
ncbi:MAG: transcription termination factor Rho [Actinomycetota bacterium]|jgi:transcription termination factor Rho|nr:transcription termination factor Rho [Actinomycetota bacterium]